MLNSIRQTSTFTSNALRHLVKLAGECRSPASFIKSIFLIFQWHILKKRGGSPSPNSAWCLNFKYSQDPFYVRPNTSDFEVTRTVLLGTQYEKAQTYLPSDAVIIDLGANIGASIRLWQKVCERATIVAVEPDRNNVALIRKNLSKNYLGLVHVLPVAAEALSGKVTFCGNDTAWALRTKMVNSSNPTQEEEIDAMSVPDILSATGLSDSSIDLMKCDIEGAEEAIFSDPMAKAWLSQVNYLAIEIHGSYKINNLKADLERNNIKYEVLDYQNKGVMSELLLRLSSADDRMT